MPEPCTPNDHLVVVIGYGNTLRGDDAVGPLVADRLRGRFCTDRVEIVVRQTLSPDLADILQGATLAIFIDAAVDGQLGQVICRSLRPDKAAMHATGHQLTPVQLLTLTSTLFDHVPESYLVTTRAAISELADSHLSPLVAVAAERMQQRVCELIEKHVARLWSSNR